jgi:predicted dehydrogenase
MSKKRYAIVGTGGRSGMFIRAILETYKETSELVAFCDLSAQRMKHWNMHVEQSHQHPPIPTYLADQFDKMVAETKPDVVIVTTMDCLHHKYIVRAMELGCDAVTEKPMTTDAEKVKAIFDAIERTGRQLRVTFNYRYMAGFTKIRELIDQGVIGRPLSVDFQWMLDTRHGADYFRRWHREKEKSGGLLVHKSTHHFDLVNWMIDSYPKRVMAMGGLKFYGRKNAAARGENYSYERYTGSAEAERDPFARFLDREEGKVITDTTKPSFRTLYLEAEKDSGYVRDRNVFGDGITIEDTMGVLAEYQNGVQLNYSLLAYCPWEGERIAVNGTKGRIEYFSRGAGHLILGQSDEELAKAQAANEKYLTVQPMFKPRYDVEIPVAKGGHGGGDARILERIFGANPEPDPFGRDANHIDGAVSVLLGVAANKSIESGASVDVEALYRHCGVQTQKTSALVS